MRKIVQLLSSMKGSFETHAHGIKERTICEAVCFSPAMFSSITFIQSRERVGFYQICGFFKLVLPSWIRRGVRTLLRR